MKELCLTLGGLDSVHISTCEKKAHIQESAETIVSQSTNGRRVECQYIANHCKQGQNSPKSRICPSSVNVSPRRQKVEGTISDISTSRRRSNKWN